MELEIINIYCYHNSNIGILVIYWQMSPILAMYRIEHLKVLYDCDTYWYRPIFKKYFLSLYLL